MIKFFNTLSKSVDDFIPLDPNSIGLYQCGPTVYSRAHIGNARTAVIFDLLYRILKTEYDHVNFVRNYTDVDDKIIEASLSSGVSISDLTNKTIIQYIEDMEYLGNLPPLHTPRATDHIQDMIEMITRLIDYGYAYEMAGHVLFETRLWGSIGILSGRSSVNENDTPSRITDQSYKKNPEDFVLWKPSSDDQPGWISPWGRGRPGWHIECSAMARKFLGATFDIHGGGSDLIFPHHENEIAQTCAACSTDRMANYWIHTGMLTVEGQKMSKSLGNIITPHDLRERGVSGQAIRMTMLLSHYRNNLDWRESNLDQVRRLLTEWSYQLEGVSPSKKQDIGFMEYLCDDMNTPRAIVRLYSLYGHRELDKVKSGLNLLGINLDQPKIDTSEIDNLIEQRNAMKEMCNWQLADTIREKIIKMGFELQDTPSGTTYKKAYLF